MVAPLAALVTGAFFKREEAMKNILRTHTTAVSAQMLYKYVLHLKYCSWKFYALVLDWLTKKEALPPRSTTVLIESFEMKLWMRPICVNFIRYDFVRMPLLLINRLFLSVG